MTRKGPDFGKAPEDQKLALRGLLEKATANATQAIATVQGETLAVNIHYSDPVKTVSKRITQIAKQYAGDTIAITQSSDGSKKLQSGALISVKLNIPVDDVKKITDELKVRLLS